MAPRLPTPPARGGLSRRRLLQAMAGGGALVGGGGLWSRSARGDEGPRYLVVMGCFGGASMLDCFMPVDRSEALVSGSRGTVLSHATVQPAGLAFRSVDRATPLAFAASHGAEAIVAGFQASSVNHFTAQARCMSGRGTWQGRTLTEAVASVYGADLPLPNVNMGRGGFAEPGTDATLESRFRGEVVSNPVTFPLSTSGHRGVIGQGPLALQDGDALEGLVEEARAVRDGTLEQVSPFAQTFGSSRLRQQLLYNRADATRAIEVQELISSLLFVPDLGEAFPIEDYGLSASSESSRILDALPQSFPTDTSGTAADRLQAQAALAYLLIRSGASAAVTLTDPGTDGFLAFDQSHQAHSSAQAAHWDRALDVASRLIGLLQGAEYQQSGTSLWDRTMLVFATEFGRDKWDTGGSFGTGHHLNNGLLMVSPLLRGNQQLGEADPNNGFICGYDADSGAPTPFDDLAPGEDPLYTDTRLPPGEEALYGTVLAAMGVSFEGQQTLPVCLKA
jgi:hypothetical protein